MEETSVEMSFLTVRLHIFMHYYYFRTILMHYYETDMNGLLSPRYITELSVFSVGWSVDTAEYQYVHRLNPMMQVGFFFCEPTFFMLNLCEWIRCRNA